MAWMMAAHTREMGTMRRLRVNTITSSRCVRLDLDLINDDFAFLFLTADATRRDRVGFFFVLLGLDD